MMRNGVVVVFLFCAHLVYSATAGGAWQVKRTRGYTSSMGTVSQNVFTRANVGSVLLSANYFTIADTIAAGDSLRTCGLDSAGNYNFLDSGTDATVLYLDGYVGQLIQVSFFFAGTTADTLGPVSVWQGLSYNQTVQDSGSFNWGMIPVDTLFTDSLNSSNNTMFVATASSAGQRSRVYTDSFVLNAPAMYLQVVNLGDAELVNDIYIEIYARHTDEVMSGVSGRLQHNIAKPIKSPVGRRR